jgi:hypothetical protein
VQVLSLWREWWPDENHLFYRRNETIRHLKLTFDAERPPPPHHVRQNLPMAAEEKGEYFKNLLGCLFRFKGGV